MKKILDKSGYTQQNERARLRSFARIFTLIKQWLQAYGERMRADRSKAKLDRLETESKRRLQVMEYEGEVYLSYDGVPLLTEDEFGSDLVETLEAMRENWKKYQWTKEAI